MSLLRRCYEQENGFTLMELMIVVVVIGILAGISVPLYNGLQERAKRAVGEDNAKMLNHSVRALMALETMGRSRDIVGEFDGSNRDHHDVLMEFIGYLGREEELKYVEWETTSVDAVDRAKGRYKVQDVLDENGLQVPED